MKVRLAGLEDVVAYAALGRAAETWLRSRGLSQYVPSAHDESAAAILSRVESGTLYAVWDGAETVGFFSLDVSPSTWWRPNETPAVYVAGVVVSREARGREIGKFIVEWCVAEATRLGRQCVRLDCHAGNPWLCRYYESQGFELKGRIEQHPGYFGCLYQREVGIADKGHHSEKHS